MVSSCITSSRVRCLSEADKKRHGPFFALITLPALVHFCSHCIANSCLIHSLASALSALQISNFLSLPQTYMIFPQLFQSDFPKPNLILLSSCVSNLSQCLCTAVLLTLPPNQQPLQKALTCFLLLLLG